MIVSVTNRGAIGIRDFYAQYFPTHVLTELWGDPEREAQEWCREQFGKNGTFSNGVSLLDTNAAWASFFHHYWFKDPDQAVMFKMVWG